MSSFLETVPYNVLCHIAYLSAASCVLDFPSDILHLMLTSRTIYRTLSVLSCPQLYADLFRVKFDIAAPGRRVRFPGALTSSTLCAELVQRYSMLRHVRLRRMSGQHLAQDLFTAYMMILESDGLNEMQLAAVGFSEYATMLVRTRLSRGTAENLLENGIDSLAVWVMWLTLSEQSVASMQLMKRNELLDLLRPLAIAASKTVPRGLQDASPQVNGEARSSLIASGCFTDQKLVHYARLLTPAWPTLSVASIILTFTLKEAQPLRIPPHLPPTRAIANATMQLGPTMEDYASMAEYRTSLIYNRSDEKPGSKCGDTRRSIVHDRDFSRIAQRLDPRCEVFRSDIRSYVPGSLNGLWEGTWMASPGTTPSSVLAPSDFLCRQPMQCNLREHICFSPHVALPWGESPGSSEKSSGLENLGTRRLVETQDGFELEDNETLSTREFCYERIAEDKSSDSGRDVSEALDIVITGETLPRHSVAWGAYKFTGRVRLCDGLIILKREPGDGDDSLGTWFFEGYLHFGAAFIGKWYSTNAANQHGIGGIFSLGRSPGRSEE